MSFPRLLRVRQHFPDRSLKDIPGEVERQLAEVEFASRLKTGDRVAIGVGSRGIANAAVIVRAAVDYWKSRGMKPFLFPAMGSHGGATPEGQAEVLARFGITEAAMGCPVVSQFDVVSTGPTPEGIETWMDRAAYESDGILLVNRVKWHTDYGDTIESGLFKMMAIGLGKFAGARRYHTHAYRMGLRKVVRTVGRQILKTGKILGGLAILEDANHNTAQITAVPAERMEAAEEKLLALVKSWMGHIPVPEVDILIVDEMGKDISGTGMDTKIINRSVHAAYNPWSSAPRIGRIFVRTLTSLSYGSAVGVGLADMITDRLLEAIDWEPTSINVLTSGALAAARVPLHYPTDRECLDRLALTVGKLDPLEVTYCWIRNTLELGRALVSENLRPVIETNQTLEIIGSPLEMTFDEAGNLPEPLAPHRQW